MRHLLRRASIAGIALAAVLVVASPVSAAKDKDKDKEGASITSAEQGSRDILGWSWGITAPAGIGSGSGGAGSGKAKLQNFNLTRRVDQLSTVLTRATMLGSHFDEVVISVPIGGPGTPFAIQYKLRLVFVESVQQSGSAGGVTESVSLAYGAFQQQIGGTTSQFGLSSADG